MNIPRNNKARLHLERLQMQFPATQELGPEPVFLDRGIDNSRAFAHSMHLASFDYPLAFGSGHKIHSIKRDANLFRHFDAHTAAIGVGQRILGGVTVVRHIAGAWDMEPTDKYATIAYLFRFRGVKPEGVRHVGKTLLSCALEYVGGTSVDGVRLEVVASNEPARHFFTEAGFEATPGGYTRNFSHKILDMTLHGKNSIAEAHDKLRAQL